MVKYFLVAVVIVGLIPVMQGLMYAGSLDIIRAIKPYHSDELTRLMNFFSYIGDGTHYFYINMIFFFAGRQYEFAYLQIAMVMNVNWVAFLKTILRHPRPQFDDPTIGVVNNSSICAGEFGNPSGHTVNTTMQMLNCLFFFKQIWAGWFQRHRAVARFFDCFVVAFIFMVSLCRLYLGRHSLDQIILGIMLGTWSAYFANNVFKRHFYDPVFVPDLDKDSTETIVSRSRKAFLYALSIYVVLITSMLSLYTYVDSTHQIPEEWVQSLRDTCPEMKKTHTFHHFSLSVTGLTTLMPAFYLWNYLKHRSWHKNGFNSESAVALAQPSTKTVVIGTIIRIIVSVILEIFWKKVPAAIYGTSDLDAFPEFVKKSL